VISVIFVAKSSSNGLLKGKISLLAFRYLKEF